MTAVRYVALWCDAKDCEQETGFEPNASQARRLARLDGWATGLPGGRDLCPWHASQEPS